MASFRFNLETVLTYRHRLEEVAKEELAGSLSVYHQEKTAMTMLQDELSATLQPVDSGKLDLQKLLLQEHYQGFLEQQLESRTERVASAREEVDQCRVLLGEKMQERKVVETLKEKRWQAFRYQEEQAEQKRTDDMATARYVRQVMDKQDRTR